MPRYEIVAHVTRELDWQLLADARLADALVHLAVWRQDADEASSALPSSLRRGLLDFFASVERSAAEAEALFRGRVEAILLAQGDAASEMRRESSGEAGSRSASPE
jgi:hypothetical protein